MTRVLKEWVDNLTLSEQGTLLTAVRGPDDCPKKHPIKRLVRVYRRVLMHGAYPVPDDFMSDREVLIRQEAAEMLGANIPPIEGEHEFELPATFSQLKKIFSSLADDLAHHYLMHLIHCAEIVGYRHPDNVVRQWWRGVYIAACESFHMNPENLGDMAERLADKGCH